MANQVLLYQIPKRLDVARVLDDSVLPVYTDSIQGLKPRAREVLGKFGSAEGQLTGSNPFMLVHLLNHGLIPGERLSERPDLEKAIIYDPEFVKEKWVDFGIVLKTPGDSYKPNDLPARLLAEQLKQKGVSLDSGKLIPFNVLRNQEHDNSAYGLVFGLNDQFEADAVRDLSDFRWDYTRDQGMAGAYLYRNRGWCYDRYLDVSYGFARVVVVGGEATTKNFDDFSSELETQKRELETRLERIRRAQAILRGE